MSDNRNDPIIGRDERDRQAEFGNADDSNRQDTQNTRGDFDDEAEFGDTGSQAEGERGATDIEDEDEDAFDDENAETLARDAETTGTGTEFGQDEGEEGQDGGFGRNGE